MTTFRELLNEAIRTRRADHPVFRYNPKLAGRELAERLGVAIPEMLSGPCNIFALTRPTAGPFVLKPSKGHSSRGVLVLEPDGVRADRMYYRDLLTGATHTWGRWRTEALAAKKMLSITADDVVSPPWWLEESLATAGHMPYEYKFYAFADGNVPLVRQRVAGPGGADEQFFDLRSGHWEPLTGTVEIGRKHRPWPGPDNPDGLLDAARRIGIEAAAPFIRVDLYERDGVPYFGEVTPSPSAGKKHFVAEWETILGDAWTSAHSTSYTS